MRLEKEREKCRGYYIYIYYIEWRGREEHMLVDDGLSG